MKIKAILFIFFICFLGLIIPLKNQVMATCSYSNIQPPSSGGHRITIPTGTNNISVTITQTQTNHRYEFLVEGSSSVVPFRTPRALRDQDFPVSLDISSLITGSYTVILRDLNDSTSCWNPNYTIQVIDNSVTTAPIISPSPLACGPGTGIPCACGPGTATPICPTPTSPIPPTPTSSLGDTTAQIPDVPAWVKPFNFSFNDIAAPNVPLANSMNNIINASLNLLIIVGIILALIFLLYGGIVWTTSGGDKQKVQQARTIFIYSIVGLILIVLSFAIIQIMGDILSSQTLSNFGK